MPPTELSPIGEAALWACLLEAGAPKAGNVHPAASFNNATWEDFVTSAHAIAPVLEGAMNRPVGRTILDCVIATQKAVGHNTNLGIILLLAPLAAVPLEEEIGPGVERVLGQLTLGDAELAFEGIRLAKPGGLGETGREDVSKKPTVTLRAAMELAASRDAIARQYQQGFRDVLATIATEVAIEGAGPNSIVLAHLRQMARQPDTLIARKCGSAIANESSRRAKSVLDVGWPGTEAGHEAFAELDAWLRGDGHRRNPGASADLIAAGLFVALRERRIRPPFEWVRRLMP